ncbi:MAG: AGE family epimerase/isomerase [Blastocatellales bacterium]
MPEEKQTTLSRRAFVGSAAALAALPGDSPAESADKLRMAEQPSQTRLVGLTLAELRRRYHDELFNIVIPFWDKHGIDHELGGFMCVLDHDGTPVNTDKFLWFQGRGIWVYSYLYRHFGKDTRHLEIARKARDFALKHFRQEDGAFAQLVSREGRVLQPPKPDTSGALSIAEGLQAWAAATGDEESRDLALKIIKDLFRQMSRPSAFGSARKQGFWFINLLIATRVLRESHDAEIAEIADAAVDAIVNRHFNPDTGLNNETLNHDFTRPPGEATLTIIGHSIEALWMVMEEALRRKDERLFATCAERVRRHIEVGWDRVYGGLIHAINVDQTCYQWPVERPVGTSYAFRFTGEHHYMKTLWSLDEVLVSTLKTLEHQDAEWAARYFDLAQEFIDSKLSMKKHGHPLHLLFADRQITHQPHISRQDNYHHFRMLMFNMQALDRMIRSGKR